nr:MAG TPA: hypothetical protein [Caudoviricetes sp.]
MRNDRNKRQPKNQRIQMHITRRRSKPIRSIHTIQAVAVTISPAKPIQTLLQSIHSYTRPRHHSLHTLQLRRNSHTKVTHPIRALIVALNTTMPRRQPLDTIVHALNQSQLIRVHTTDTRFLPLRSRQPRRTRLAPKNAKDTASKGTSEPSLNEEPQPHADPLRFCTADLTAISNMSRRESARG